MVTFIFYCVVLPATIVIPEVQVPIWGSIYIPSVITILNAVGTPRLSLNSAQNLNFPNTSAVNFGLLSLTDIMLCRSLHLVVFWILFENVMSLHRTKATLIGLLEAGRANEWIVTEKLGDAIKKFGSKSPKKPRFRIGERYFSYYALNG